MVDTAISALLALSVVAVLSLLVLLLREPCFGTPAELTVRLGMLEQSFETISQSSTRNEAGIERMEPTSPSTRPPRSLVKSVFAPAP